MSKLFLGIWLGIIAVWSLMVLYTFWLAIRPVQSGEEVDRPALGQTPATLSPTIPPATGPPVILLPSPPTELTPMPLPTLPPTPGTLPVPPAGGVVLVLTPPAQAAGWTTSLDGQGHFNDGKIYTGFFGDHVYHGAVRFDLSDVPPGSQVLYAALELSGLSAKNLAQGGVWQVRLLNPAIETVWAALTYDRLRQAQVDATLQPALPRSALGPEVINVLPFDTQQLALLEQRLERGSIAFRLDGPSTGPDNLFIWSGGWEPVGTATGTAVSPPVTTSPQPPVLRVVVAALNYVVITSTPTPANVLTAAALMNHAGATPTPLPANWVTPVIVVTTSTPTPADEATALYQAQVATAEAVVYGTPTAPPVNVNFWTATPTPVLVSPASSPRPAQPVAMPDALLGKIAFLSDRAGGAQPQVYVIDPATGELFQLQAPAFYELAETRDKLSARQELLAFVQDVTTTEGRPQSAIFFYDYAANLAEQVTRFQASQAGQPAWSPAGERLAFVSDDSGAEEIWTINRDGSDAQQLTRDDPVAVDGHPSWSPDGSQIVFWSNRTGRAQLWIMNADGVGQRLLAPGQANDWNPAWIKYQDTVNRPLPEKRFTP